MIEDTIATAEAGGQGIAVAYAHWAAAILHNGLGHYQEALTAARQASDDVYALHIAMWALPELVEAAARSGDVGIATDAVDRLAEYTQAGGTDFGLGIEARSRALITGSQAAEDLYREAIDRLGRTRLRPELARAHLLYGEWLRREGRRADARTHLRTAHEMLSDMGVSAFAEQARHELAATGETARRRRVDTVTAPHRAGGAHRPARGRGEDQPGDRRSAVRQPPHGGVAHEQDLHQARRQFTSETRAGSAQLPALTARVDRPGRRVACARHRRTGEGGARWLHTSGTGRAGPNRRRSTPAPGCRASERDGRRGGAAPTAR